MSQLWGKKKEQNKKCDALFQRCQYLLTQQQKRGWKRIVMEGRGSSRCSNGVRSIWPRTVLHHHYFPLSHQATHISMHTKQNKGIVSILVKYSNKKTYCRDENN